MVHRTRHLLRCFDTITHLAFPYFSIDTGDADPLRIISVAAKDGRTGQDIQLKYTNYKIIGNGSFGVVYHAKLVQGGEDTAIKKVMQDRRFKVRNTIEFRYKAYGYHVVNSFVIINRIVSSKSCVSLTILIFVPCALISTAKATQR
jgi:hypothetical protein